MTATDTVRAEAPVVAADEVQWHVLCPHCGEIHHHGAGGRDGYRTPHCRVSPAPPDYRITDPLGLTGEEAER